MMNTPSRFLPAYFVAILSFSLGASAVSSYRIFPDAGTQAGLQAAAAIVNIDASRTSPDLADAVPSEDPALLPATFCHAFAANLRKGDAGIEVGFLHSALDIAHLRVTGADRGKKPLFGNATLTAVKRFQEKNALPQTGFVGPQTRKALDALSSCSVPLDQSAVISDPDFKREAAAIPSSSLVQGKNAIFREKVWAVSGRSLGVETFGLKAKGVSLSHYQVFAYFGKDFSGAGTFLSAIPSSATTSVSFDLSSIPLPPGQSRFIEVTADAKILADNARLSVSRAGLQDAVLSGSLDPRSLWYIKTLDIPATVYGNTDFIIRATIATGQGTLPYEKFKAVMTVKDNKGKTAYQYAQLYSGRTRLPSKAEDFSYFGTVGAGTGGAAMNFPAGHYLAALSLYDIDTPSLVLATLSAGFDVSPKDAPSDGSSSFAALTSDSVEGLLADFRDAAIVYRHANLGYGVPVSVCGAGMFADPLMLPSVNALRKAEGSIMTCLAAPESYAVSVKPSADEDPICIDGFGSDSIGNPLWSGKGVAYCLIKSDVTQ